MLIKEVFQGNWQGHAGEKQDREEEEWEQGCDLRMILQETLEFKVYTTELYQLRRDTMKTMGWRYVLEGRSLKKEIQKGLDGKAHQRGRPPPQGTVKTLSRGPG